MKGGYLFQVRPDLFPQGCLTATEMELWGMHYEEKQRKR